VTWKPDYLTLPQGRDALRITDAGDTVDDAQISSWITSISRMIDDRCNRQFGQLPAPAARTYRRAPVWRNDLSMWVQVIDDVQDATGLLVNGVAYATAGAVLLPDNASGDGVPWTALGWTTWPGCDPMIHTAKWGWTAVPAGVPVAARLQLSRLNWRRDAPAGVAGSPDQGSEIRMLAKLDPDAITALRGLARPRWGG
jgi:hypothetical protein